MSKIVYKDNKHLYFNGKTEYSSVSRFSKQFFNQFDSNQGADRKVLRELFPKDYVRLKKIYHWNDPALYEILRKLVTDEKAFKEAANVLKKEWRTSAKKSTDRGTELHDDFEKLAIKEGGCMNLFNNKFYKLQNCQSDRDVSVDNLFDLKDGFHQEVIIYNDEHKIAGRIDKLFIDTIGSYRYFDVDDWKSDKNMLRVPDFYDKVKGYKTLRYPFTNVYDAPLGRYSVKINVYAWMLCKAGFVARNLGLTHFNMDAEKENILFAKLHRIENLYNTLDNYINNEVTAKN